MKIRWILALALTAFGSTACVTRNDTLKLDIPAENKATVYGLAETKVMFGVERDLSITAIDGVNTFRGWGKGYPVSVELTPGRHTLTVLYRITDQGAPGPTGETKLEVDVRAGRTYVSDLVLEDGRWTPSIREITDEEMRVAEERRAKIRAEQFEN
ncbi:MAG: hypothetical protein NTY35_14085 [Planctomycetota bacterium]|nr:hypothetical protein [Planctomycetota bacterium]